MKFWTDDRDDSTFKSEAYQRAFPTSKQLFGHLEEKDSPDPKVEAVESEVSDWRDESFWGCYGG